MFTKIINLKFIKQFISYFCVGGISAVVEWSTFFIFFNVCGFYYLLATFLAFIVATGTNYVLGALWTFKDNSKQRKKKLLEIFQVFFVSGIGLIFNLLLMYLLVDIMQFNSTFQQMASKIVATGIVFLWNFGIRKFVIYKS